MTTSITTKLALPNFDHLLLHVEAIVPMITEILSKNTQILNDLLDQCEQSTLPNFNDVCRAWEEREFILASAVSPVIYLYHVMQSEALRRVYYVLLPLLSHYHTEVAQNVRLFRMMSALRESTAYHTQFSVSEKKVIDHHLRDFKLAGVYLPADEKAEFSALKQALSELKTKFSDNVLDATQAWTLCIPDPLQLKGLTESALHLAKSLAKERGKEGYLLVLDQAMYSACIKSLDDRDLRRVLYEAYVTRASDQGPHDQQWDNGTIMEKILLARTKMSKLLGFSNFAEYSLATKMAKTTEEVSTFLKTLLVASKPFAQQEWEHLSAFAKERDGLTALEAWDVDYYSHHLQAATLGFTEEDCRPYFPITQVLNGLFAVLHQLFGITFHEENDVDRWHPSVLFFSIYDAQGTLRGGIYMDLYARSNKQSGAWMDACRMRCKYRGAIQYPVAYLTCNFMPPIELLPALLTHHDVVTLFHECGHCLHHVLTKVDHLVLSGTEGVPWDAVELPSQFLESFAWEKEVLRLCSLHYKRKEQLPAHWHQQMVEVKHLQSGLHLLRQLEYALFDFELHCRSDAVNIAAMQTILDQVRCETALYSIPPWQRTQHSFAHIFSGGYAAGYYSYLWAEVLSADAFDYFQNNGLLNSKIGYLFMQNILEAGGVPDLMAAFVSFRGRLPSIDALLRQHGIAKNMKKTAR